MSYQYQLEIDFHGIDLEATVETEYDWLSDDGIPPEMDVGAQLVQLVGCGADDKIVDAMWMCASNGSNAAVKAVVDQAIWDRHQGSLEE